MSQPTICIGDDGNFSSFRHRYAEIHLGLDNGERVCETKTLSNPGEKLFRWCMVHGETP